MRRYRITKYNPLLRDNQGHYISNEWTSYSDIGKVFHGNIFTNQEYENMEKNYILSLKNILRKKKISELSISDIEKNFELSEIIEMLANSNLSLTDSEKELYEKANNNVRIRNHDLEAIIKLLLRECLWCKLSSTIPKISIEIGYDFYVYVYCDNISDDVVEEIAKHELFLEIIE